MTLHIVAIFMLFVAVFTTLLFAHESSAAPGINQTLNFQGRLLRSSGAPVQDGYYNIQFTLYEGGNGTQAGNPGGQAVWTETYVNNNANGGIRVKNGLMSVNLGSQTPFGQSVNWNNDTLWLSMNVAGSQSDCTSFNQGSCTADGEMLPMKRLTSTPYAMNAGALGGKAAENFVQIAQGVQTDTSNNTSSIHLNKTGTGNIIQLQNDGNNVFSVTNEGNLEFGNSRDHAIYVGGSPENSAGRNLTIFAGYGGSGDGSMGGSLFLQGGSAGGDNANGGDVAITGGTGNGTGRSGSVYIGASDTDTVQIGSAWHTGTQTINIGNNSGTGRTDVTVGGKGTGSGETRIQSGDDTTISTNGTQRARFSGEGNTLYLGNADSSGQATVANGFTIQGTSSTGADTQGGDVNIIAGSATNGNANGGNLTLRGGSGSGDGAEGLVVISTPTFQTSSGDANCFTGGSLVSTSCTFTSTSVNSSAVLVAGFNQDGQTATLPDPATSTSGRIVYITAAGDTKPFVVRTNSLSNSEKNIRLKPNESLSLLWNGNDWTTVGTSYGNYESNSLATNSGAEFSGIGPESFPENTWHSSEYNPIVRNTNSAYVASGNASVKVGDANAVLTQYYNIYNHLSTALQPSTIYSVSLKTYLDSSSDGDIMVAYHSRTENFESAACTFYETVVANSWNDLVCTFETPPTLIDNSNQIFIGGTIQGNSTLYIDDLNIRPASETTNNSQNLNNTEVMRNDITVQSVDDDSVTPPDTELLGSMYYDESLGKVQCYEAEGWGSCGAAPDTFVTLSPSYPGVVVDESKTNAADFSTGFCSGTLNVNADGDNPICSTNETYNYYQLSTSEVTPESSLSTLYVTYSLPDNFKEFVSEATSVMAKSQNVGSEVRYHIYKNTEGDLTPCGDMITAASNTSSSWQKSLASDTSDPASCGFKSGDSILLKIELSLPPKTSAEGVAAAYVSDINFVFQNK